MILVHVKCIIVLTKIDIILKRIPYNPIKITMGPPSIPTEKLIKHGPPRCTVTTLDKSIKCNTTKTRHKYNGLAIDTTRQ